MRRQAARRRAWLRRLGWLWPDRNPLRRSCDRVEALITAGLVAAFVIGGPLAALAAGNWVADSGLRAGHASLSAWHQVPAVLLTAASARQQGSPVTARAGWTAPGGTRRTGRVQAPAGSPAGTTVRIWVDAAGRPGTPPLEHSQVNCQVVQAALLAAIALALALGGAGLAVRHLLDQRRLAAWDAEWRATGPQWSHHG